MASIGIGIGIVKMSAKLLVLVLVLLRGFPKVLVLVLGRNFGIGHLWDGLNLIRIDNFLGCVNDMPISG